MTVTNIANVKFKNLINMPHLQFSLPSAAVCTDDRK